ncbi:MAG TPA: LysR family transcriptional regulator [Polyangiaceae bacterium]|nr:LysR family transcriptional regulator [Polyangiaceae bacterium]
MGEPAETSELQAFVQTADHRSVSRAARELGVPRATVSRRLARLEEHLGVRLLRRTTRSLGLTDAGEAFYGYAKLALDAVGRAEAVVRVEEGDIRGPLRISVPPMRDPSFQRFLVDFSARHPLVELQVHSASRFVDLQAGGYHVALRAGTHFEPGLVARKLGRVPVLLMAAPKYLEQRGVPTTLKDLTQHDCLASFDGSELPQAHWPLVRGGNVSFRLGFATNDLDLLRVAAVEGRGLAMLPLQGIVSELESGALVPVLTDLVGAEATLAAVYVEREFMPAAVRAFVDEVAEWASANLFREVVERCSAQGKERRVPRRAEVAAALTSEARTPRKKL